MNSNNIARIGVIGAGSWGTTLANLLAGKGFSVDLWVREEEVYEQLINERVNHSFLPGVVLDPRLNPVRSFEEALTGKQLLLMAVPSHVFREVLSNMKPYLMPGVPLTVATKGIENETLLIMSQVAEEVLGSQYTHKFACLAGPSFAKEVSKRSPTAVTIACREIEHASLLQQV